MFKSKLVLARGGSLHGQRLKAAADVSSSMTSELQVKKAGEALTAAD
jgi:hypothetical protein